MFGRNKQNKPRLTLYERLMGTKEPDIDSIDLSGIDTNNPYFAENTGMDEPQVKISTSQNPRVGGIFPDISAGYQENRSNPISVNNFGNNTLADGRNKGFAYKLGEFGGSLARIADSPLGRGLITGAAIAALGGTPAETLAYGATAGAINQGNRSRDSVYRQQMLQSLQDQMKNSAEWETMTEEQKTQALQNAENYVSSIRGYIGNDTYKNFVQAQQLRDNAEWRKINHEDNKQYHNDMLDLRRDNMAYQRQRDKVEDYYKNRSLSIQEKAAENKGTPNLKDTLALANHFDSLPEVKNFKEIDRQFNNVKKVYDDYKAGKLRANASDQAMITTLNKILDPTSVVRESEFARTAQGQATLAKIEGYAKKITRGGSGLTDKERQDLFNSMQTMHAAAYNTYQTTSKNYIDMALRYGINPDDIIRYGSNASTNANSSVSEGTIIKNAKTGQRMIWEDGKWQTL